jgi:hypothetical protein
MLGPTHSNVQNFFHFDADNVGDQLCGPANYFPDLRATKRNFSSYDKLAANLLLGGGLVFNQVSRLSAIATSSGEACKLVCWGAGVPPRGVRDREVRDVAKRFSLFGTRNYDWADQFDFVPCVSCMSPVFDYVPEPSHEIVIFAHRRKTPDLLVPKGIPFKTNTGQSAQEAIGFIASGKTVVTSSYHGVYWAQLLGRKVVCIPFNNKFETFEHSPFFASSQNWMHKLDQASKTEPLLSQYREINKSFFERVLNILNFDKKDSQL